MIILLIASAVYGFLTQKKMPTSAELKSSTTAVSRQKTAESSSVKTAPSATQTVASSKENPLQKEIAGRISKAKQNIELRDGKQVLYADESYGGKTEAWDGETPIAKLSIPVLNFEREIWQGIGVNPEGRVGEGDSDRLFKASTWRDGQVLGGDNFVVAAHVWNGQGFTDYSNEWFSPLLHNGSGGMTTQVSELKLKKGDEMFVEELSTGLKFKFVISEIEISPKENGGISETSRKHLSSRIDHPRLTLQGCLQGEPSLLFVVGELTSVQSSDEQTYNYESSN